MRPPGKSRNKNRNNSRRPNPGNVINRVFDSAGPEGKVRGTPQQIIDKYQSLAHDSQLSGDRVSAENFQHVYATNTIAPICILNALHQNLAKSTEKLVLVVSSKMGSISDNQSGKSYAYRSSKTALNSIMISAALDLAAQNIKILLLHPGWVKTDMTGDHAPIDAKTSVAGMLSIAQQADHWKSGTFIDYKQDLINW